MYKNSFKLLLQVLFFLFIGSVGTIISCTSGEERQDLPSPEVFGTSGGGDAPCIDIYGKEMFCQWNGSEGCFPIYGTCETAIKDCQKFGKLYNSNNCEGDKITEPVELPSSNSTDYSSSSISGTPSDYVYCDFGPVNQWGGGCFNMAEELADDPNYECDLDWGMFTNECGSGIGYFSPEAGCLGNNDCWWQKLPSSSSRGSSSSSSVQLGPDPRPTSPKPMTTQSALTYLSDVKAGWNLGNTMEAVNSAKTLAVETAWGNPAATQTLLDGVKAQGFDIVRIGCTWIGHIGPAPDYIVSEARLQRVAEIVNMVHNAGMKAIINIHHDGNYTEPPNTWGFLKFAEVGRGTANNEQVKEQLGKVWTQIANYFKNYGDDLIFETMNEVHSGNWGNGVSSTERNRLFDWNQTALNAIRSTGGNNAKRFVAVPTVGSTEPEMVIAAHNSGKLLPSDPGNGTNRLIVSVHFYAPWQYTVADVTGQGGEGRNTITTAELNAIDTEAAHIKSTFINNGIAVYYGEWGAPTNVRAAMSETIKSTHIDYIRRVAAATKANGIVPIIWDDGGDFKMLERSNGTPKTGLWKDVRDAYINATSSSSGSEPPPDGLYCDFGVFDSYGGGCYLIENASECDTKHGTVKTSCPRKQYCDFGPVTEHGGGCNEIYDANECDMDWGILTNTCNSRVGYTDPDSECLKNNWCWWLL